MNERIRVFELKDKSSNSALTSRTKEKEIKDRE